MKKILVIFFFAFFFSILIFKLCYKQNNQILLLGENIFNLNDFDSKNTKTFFYDNITYKELINCIINNDFVIIKGKKIYLNQLISSSSKIIIKASTNEYNNKCKKNKSVFSNYKDRLNNSINELKNKINRISNADIIIVNNYCEKYY